MKENNANAKPTRREFLSRGAWATSLFGLGAVAGILPGSSKAQTLKSKAKAKPVPSSTFDSLFKTDPKLITYEEGASWSVDLKEIRGLAVGPDDLLGLAGDQRIQILDDSRNKVADHTLGGAVRCLAIPSTDQVFACLRDRVVIVQIKEGKMTSWDPLGKGALITSIAVRGQDVFVADAGNRCVLHYDLAGRLIRRLRKGEPQPGQKAFIVPSPYFDLALDTKDQLWVVNPGQHRLEAYSRDGQFKESWGQASYAITGFCGCCNPAHLALLPDGRFVTSEKGIPRIKIYSSRGDFESVVAGAESFAPYVQNPNSSPVGLEIAADSKGRVLVGDSLARKIRVFAPKTSTTLSSASI